MFEPLLWMFKAENFKNNFMYLASRILILLVLALIFVITGLVTINHDLLISQVLFIISLLIPIFAFLFMQGYFWELTECIINRDTDVTSANVYTKKSVKLIEKIEFPELDFKKFVWRGFASIIATAMLLYPIILLVGLSAFTAGETFSLLNFGAPEILYSYFGLYCFIGLFIPALLWNYANRNSLFAVWNLPKAIHIIGTYPGRYLFKVAQFLLFGIFVQIVNAVLSLMFGISTDMATANDAFSVAKVFLFLLAAFSFNLYNIFVSAYILGTIAPREEA